MMIVYLPGLYAGKKESTEDIGDGRKGILFYIDIHTFKRQTAFTIFDKPPDRTLMCSDSERGKEQQN